MVRIKRGGRDVRLTEGHGPPRRRVRHNMDGTFRRESPGEATDTTRTGDGLGEESALTGEGGVLDINVDGGPRRHGGRRHLVRSRRDGGVREVWTRGWGGGSMPSSLKISDFLSRGIQTRQEMSQLTGSGVRGRDALRKGTGYVRIRPLWEEVHSTPAAEVGGPLKGSQETDVFKGFSFPN